MAAQSRVCQVASLSCIFAGLFWRLVREWKVQLRGSLRDFRGSSRDLLAGRPSSREKHLDKFSKFCSCVLWRLELATVWRLVSVTKIACFVHTGAVFKFFVFFFPRSFCDCSLSSSFALSLSHCASFFDLHCLPLLSSQSSTNRYVFSILNSFYLLLWFSLWIVLI